MGTSSLNWTTRIKLVFVQLSLIDWLTVLVVLSFGWLATQIIGVVEPESSSLMNLIPLFLSGAIVIGYCYRPSINKVHYSFIIPSSVRQSTTWITGITWLVIGLPLIVFLSVQQISSEGVLLSVISTLLLVLSATIVGSLCNHLPKQWGIPLLLLTLYWLLIINNLFVNNLTQAMLSNDLETQAIVLMIAVGLLGVIASIAEFTKPWQRQLETSRYVSISRFDSPMPSFTGMGSLLIVSSLRILRDKVFIIYFGSFIILLLSRILVNNWQINWLTIVGLTLAGLSALIITRLVKFSFSFLDKFSYLPIQPGQIEFVGYFAGLIIIAAISWIIIWGLFGVTGENMARLLAASLSGYGAGFLVGLSYRKINHLGVFDSFWRFMVQLLVFILVFIYSLQLPLSGATTSLLILMLLAMSTTCYQVSQSSATIKSNG
ncbi:MAG: hypothetical protein NUV80_03225 [Candidatus Berkelbacteria bacterium]|nr:hypothetical protein [Candidatus Berkelbacteria bacterium]MCR4307546.1 hypothetical protein [Candidatus Berkelbacteria bacterium]